MSGVIIMMEELWQAPLSTVLMNFGTAAAATADCSTAGLLQITLVGSV